MWRFAHAYFWSFPEARHDTEKGPIQTSESA